MKLVAMMVCRNEADRYLKPCLESLAEFCDEIRVLDDASTDGSADILNSFDIVRCKTTAETHFYEHEGRTRQRDRRLAPKEGT